MMLRETYPNLREYCHEGDNPELYTEIRTLVDNVPNCLISRGGRIFDSSNKPKGVRNSRKISDRDTYEEIIWDILEDTLELNEQTKKDIELSKKEYERGNFLTLEQVKKKLGF